MGFGAIGAGAKIKQFFQKLGKGIVKGVKTVANWAGKAMNNSAVKNVVNMITNMVGIPLPVGDIIQKCAEIVSAGADIADNFISGKKNIL
jgi:hypothetical protein